MNLNRSQKLILFASIAVAISLISFVISFNLVKTNDETFLRQAKQTCAKTKYCTVITRNSLNPDTVAIPVGSKLVVASGDRSTHNLVIGDSTHHQTLSSYQSGEFGAGEAWEVIAKKPVTITLTDQANKNLKLAIVVYEPGKDYKIKN